MRTNSRFITLWIIACSSMISACSKNWLDEKPLKSMVVPSTIDDFKAILSNTNSFDNRSFNYYDPGLGMTGSDEYYTIDIRFPLAPIPFQNAYKFKSDVYEGTRNITSWNIPYRRIFNANVVLDGIDKILPKNSNEQAEWNQVKGAAYFFRGYNHYLIAQIFCEIYKESTAQTDLGIPLRLSSDFGDKSVRASVAETYESIISDLKSSADLLTIEMPNSITTQFQPTRAAAFAMLARVYLTMSDYDNALLYSEKCLDIYNELHDYNSLDAASLNPFAQPNKEVIFNSNLANETIYHPAFSIADTTLYSLFDNQDDLRQSVFFGTFAGHRIFKGSYSGTFQIYFSGLATDEIYLIKAECHARMGERDLALDDLNFMLEKRWKSGTYIPLTADSDQAALQLIVIERRKELCFRGLRWTDLKRLNMEVQFETIVTHKIDGQEYILTPNDPKYILPIPDEVIQLSGMQQNARE